MANTSGLPPVETEEFDQWRAATSCQGAVIAKAIRDQTGLAMPARPVPDTRTRRLPVSAPRGVDMLEQLVELRTMLTPLDVFIETDQRK